MARIQKKKTATKNKKKQNGTRPKSSTRVVDIHTSKPGESVSSPTAATAGAEKKKKAFTAKRPSAAEQSAVMKLVEKYFGTWIQFLREVRVELTKVSWPSKQQTIGSTAVVIVFVFVIAIFLGIVDFGLSSMIRLIL